MLGAYIRSSTFREPRIPINVTYIGDEFVLYTYKFGGPQHGRVSRKFFNAEYKANT